MIYFNLLIDVETPKLLRIPLLYSPARSKAGTEKNNISLFESETFSKAKLSYLRLFIYLIDKHSLEV